MRPSRTESAFPGAARGRAGLVLLLLLVAGAAAIWWWRPHWLPTAIRTQLPTSPEHGEVLYRWTGPDGVVQYTDHPPPAGVPYDELRGLDRRNVIPARSDGKFAD